MMGDDCAGTTEDLGRLLLGLHRCTRESVSDAAGRLLESAVHAAPAERLGELVEAAEAAFEGLEVPIEDLTVDGVRRVLAFALAAEVITCRVQALPALFAIAVSVAAPRSVPGVFSEFLLGPPCPSTPYIPPIVGL